MALVAIAGSGVVIALLAATGEDPRGQRPLSLEGTEDTADFREEGRAVYERFAGSQDDLQALEVLKVVETPEWAAWRECLAAEGEPLPPASRHIAYAPPTRPFNDLYPSWPSSPLLTEPGAPAMTNATLAHAFLWSMNPPPFKDPFVLAEDVEECRALTPVERFEAAPRPPARPIGLKRKWERALLAAVESVGDEAELDYQACLRERLPVRKDMAYGPDGDEITDATYIWFHDYYDWGDRGPTFSQVPVFGHGESDAWRDLVEREQSFLVVNWACRRPTYEAAAAVAAPAIARIATEHRAEIDLWAAYWQDVRRQARAQGWDSDLSYDELVGGHLR